MIASTFVVAGLGVGVATAQPEVVETYDTPGQPSDIQYAYGAAWAQVGPNSVTRITPGGQTQTANLPGTVLDLTEGFNRVWVLWRSGSTRYVAQINRRTGKLIGSPRRIRVAGRGEQIDAGAGYVWVTDIGAGRRVARFSPRNLRPRYANWPGGSILELFIEKNRVYTFVGESTKNARLIERRRSNLRNLRSVRVLTPSVGTHRAYGSGSFYVNGLSSPNPGFGPNIAQISPRRGVVNNTATQVPTSQFTEWGCIAVGLGNVWSLWEQFDPSSWKLVVQTNQGQPVGDFDQPATAASNRTPCVAVGGGYVWITSPGTRQVFQMNPSSFAS
jgi:hypothetical protein